MLSVAKKDEVVKWREKKVQALELSKKFKTIGGNLFARGCRMETCGDFLSQSVCPVCGTQGHITAQLCRDRLCPVCAWRLSRARYAQMRHVISLLEPVMKERKAYVQFITLTQKNVPLADLAACLRDMSAAWSRLRKRKPFSAEGAVIGWARNVEITWNPQRHDAHPHIHLLVIWDGAHKAEAEEAGREIERLWKQASRLSYTPVCDAKEAYTKGQQAEEPGEKAVGAALEATKYSVKPGQLFDMSNRELDQFAQQIRGFRFAAYGGLIKEIRSKLGFADDDYNELDSSTCAKCGSKMVEILLAWNGSDYVITTIQAGRRGNND